MRLKYKQRENASMVHLLSRVWRTVMTRRGISVIRKRPITITSMRVVLCESRCFLLSRITCNMT